MPKQVMRTESRNRSALNGRLAAHVAGRSRPEGAATRAEWGHQAAVNLTPGIDLDAISREHDRIARRKRKGGRPGAPFTEFLFAGPPAFEDPNAWEKKEVLSWAQDCADWVSDGLEDGRAGTLVAAWLHVDEKAPHVHIVVMNDTARDERGGTKFSKTDVELTLLGRDERDHRKRAAALQDAHYEAVASGYGLERGERGSDRKHEAVTVGRGAGERAKLLEGKLARLQPWDKVQAVLDVAVFHARRTGDATASPKVRGDVMELAGAVVDRQFAMAVPAPVPAPQRSAGSPGARAPGDRSKADRGRSSR